MAANAYLKSIGLGFPGWTKLATVPIVVNATIIADTKNSSNIQVRFRGGPTSNWPPGAAVPLESVDLSEIEVQGGVGHKVHVAGYAPGSDPRGDALAKMLSKMPPTETQQGGDTGETGGGDLGGGTG